MKWVGFFHNFVRSGWMISILFATPSFAKCNSLTLNITKILSKMTSQRYDSTYVGKSTIQFQTGNLPKLKENAYAYSTSFIPKKFTLEINRQTCRLKKITLLELMDEPSIWGATLGKDECTAVKTYDQKSKAPLEAINMGPPPSMDACDETPLTPTQKYLQAIGISDKLDFKRLEKENLARQRGQLLIYEKYLLPFCEEKLWE